MCIDSGVLNVFSSVIWQQSSATAELALWPRLKRKLREKNQMGDNPYIKM